MLRLGYKQKQMMLYMTPKRKYSIARDRESRKIASSLEKRNLIDVNRDFECWTIWLKQ